MSSLKMQHFEDGISKNIFAKQRKKK